MVFEVVVVVVVGPQNKPQKDKTQTKLMFKILVFGLSKFYPDRVIERFGDTNG